MKETTPRLNIVMGVAGCGKSTVGRALAERLGGTYLEGDELHPPANIEKMSRGIPLSDDDRWPWLDLTGRAMRKSRGTVFAGCSALKRSYRDRLRMIAAEPIRFIFLDGDRDVIASRMNAREGHFMPPALLDSQFETLEVPEPDEDAIRVDIDQPLDDLVGSVCRKLTG